MREKRNSLQTNECVKRSESCRSPRPKKKDHDEVGVDYFRAEWEGWGGRFSSAPVAAVSSQAKAIFRRDRRAQHHGVQPSKIISLTSP